MKKSAWLIIPFLLLSACARPAQKPAFQWSEDTHLSAQDKAKYETQISNLQHKIDTYRAGSEDGSMYAPIPDFIDRARAHEALGDYRSALGTYQKGLSLHRQSQAFIHNMGRLYEKIHDVDSAVAQYRTLVDKYNQPAYLYDITWAYISAGDRKKAEKAFNEWQNKFHTTDLETQNAIKKLRAQEDKTLNPN